MAEINKKIIVGLSGGLGNQMFQYATGRSLALDLGVNLQLDLSWFAGRQDRTYALSDFNIDGHAVAPLKYFPDQVRNFESRISRRWSSKRMGGEIFRERQFHFDPKINQLDPSIYLEGYWQSEKYFKNNSKQIAEEFLLKSDVPDRCRPILTALQNTQAICLHIRRGDYLNNETAAKVHGVCPVSYYQQGIEILLENLSTPHCFIFSDEPIWAKENLSLPCSSTVVDVNNAAQAHWDLFLMQACTHFVIANSSLSWWGAWLGKDKGKRVIAPQKWFLTDDKNTKDLLPDNWECI